MKILIIGNSVSSLVNFRWHLLMAWQDQGYEVVALAPDVTEDDRVRFAGINVRLMSMPLNNTAINPFADIKLLFKLYQFIRREQPDWVFTYTIKAVIYGSIAAAFAKVKHKAAMITGLGYVFIDQPGKRKLLKSLVKPLYKLALCTNRLVFFQNKDDQNLFVNSGLVQAKKTVLINGSGVDLNHFQQTPLPDATIFILIARLLIDKGIGEYIQAAERIKRRYPQAKFLLLGGQSTNPAAMPWDVIEQAVAKSVIEYLAELKDVRPALSQASVFVLPSYREGCPHAALEALAMGRPIITTDVPGCREVVIPGENGYLLPVKSVEALVTAMESFILNPQSIEKMGQASRRLAEQRFDVHQVNAVILNAIASCHVG